MKVWRFGQSLVQLWKQTKMLQQSRVNSEIVVHLCFSSSKLTRSNQDQLYKHLFLKVTAGNIYSSDLTPASCHYSCHLTDLFIQPLSKSVSSWVRFAAWLHLVGPNWWRMMGWWLKRKCNEGISAFMKVQVQVFHCLVPTIRFENVHFILQYFAMLNKTYVKTKTIYFSSAQYLEFSENHWSHFNASETCSMSVFFNLSSLIYLRWKSFTSKAFSMPDKLF